MTRFNDLGLDSGTTDGFPWCYEAEASETEVHTDVFNKSERARARACVCVCVCVCVRARASIFEIPQPGFHLILWICEIPNSFCVSTRFAQSVPQISGLGDSLN